MAAALLVAGCAGAPPPAPRTEHVNAPDGVVIEVDEAGRGTPELVFVHSWSCNRRQFDSQLAAFAGSHRVVLVDLPGHGGSQGRQRWSFDSLARDVLAVLEHLDLRDAVLVGHGIGGHVCLRAAVLDATRVRGVIGVDSLHDAEFSWDAATRDAIRSALRFDLDGALRAFVRGLFPPHSDPEVVQRVLDDVTRVDPDTAIGLLDCFPELDLARDLAAVRVPVACINGDTRPTRVRINRRYRPDFDAVVLEETGHFPMLERPTAFDAALARLLREMPPRPAAGSR